MYVRYFTPTATFREIHLAAPIVPKTNPVLRAVLIAACVILFAASIAYSAFKVRYEWGDGAKHNEITVTELTLSHSLKRGDDGSLVLKPGNVTNKGARRPCPT